MNINLDKLLCAFGNLLPVWDESLCGPLILPPWVCSLIIICCLDHCPSYPLALTLQPDPFWPLGPELQQGNSIWTKAKSHIWAHSTFSEFWSGVAHHFHSFCHIPNSTWIPEVFLSHSWVISVRSPSDPQVLPSTLKYSQVSQINPELVHLCTSSHPNTLYSPESSSKSPPRFRNSSPVLLTLHSVYSELTYIWVSKLPSPYPLSSSLHSCIYINPFWILGSSEAMFPPLSTFVTPEHCPEILFPLHLHSFPFCINTLHLPSCTLVWILT